MLIKFVHKFLWIVLGFWLCGLLATAYAGTYPLTDGTSVTGDVISYNDEGVIFHTADDKYTDRISWTKFSQDALKALAKDPKAKDYAEPFIETPPPARPALEVRVHDVQRLVLPPKQSVIGALFSSSLGIILILLIWAANIYAGFEVAIFRAQRVELVAGLAAILPIVGPIIFLCMPIKTQEPAPQDLPLMEAAAVVSEVVGVPQPAPEGQPPSTTEGVHIAPAGWQAATAIPETQVFKRGQFTFNRRFIETKFSGFFGMTRHGADKDMVLMVKTPRTEHIVYRITRIATNDAHFEVAAGAGRQEVMVPFGEIQEIQLKHKDA
jgi:hypothetical protein